MEVEFGNLLKARRGEEVFYCFSEAREKFFSSMGDNTLNNAVEYLGVETTSRLHVPQNRRLIKAMLGRSYPVTSKRIGRG